jgi:hypothetical protein
MVRQIGPGFPNLYKIFIALVKSSLAFPALIRGFIADRRPNPGDSIAITFGGG